MAREITYRLYIVNEGTIDSPKYRINTSPLIEHDKDVGSFERAGYVEVVSPALTKVFFNPTPDGRISHSIFDATVDEKDPKRNCYNEDFQTLARDKLNKVMSETLFNLRSKSMGNLEALAKCDQPDTNLEIVSLPEYQRIEELSHPLMAVGGSS
jgi:hypothetical protein